MSARWQEVAAALARGDREIHLFGLTPAAGAYLLSRLGRTLRCPILLVTPDGDSAEVFLKDLAFFGAAVSEPPGNWSLLQGFPAHEILTFRPLGLDAEVSAARLAGAYLALTSREPVFLVASAAALREKLPPRSRLQEAWTYLVIGEDIPRQEFLQRLQQGGYERRPLVEERGEFSVRGGIIDFFPPLYDRPVRLEFWGDTLESLRFFDPATQRSQGSLEDLVVLPASEVILDEDARERALQGRSKRRDPRFWHHVQEGIHFSGIERHLAEFYPEPQTLWDYLPPETLVVEWDPLNLGQSLEKLAADAAGEPPGWLDAIPWEVRRAPFATVSSHALPLGETEGPSCIFFQTDKNEGLAQELAEAGSEDGRLVPALAHRLADWLAGASSQTRGAR